MLSKPIRFDLSGRRLAAPFYFETPVHVVNETGKEVAIYRSPKKFAKAVMSGELILLAGDAILVGGQR